MKKILLIISLMFSGFSQAALIELEFDKDNYEVNDTVYGQLVVSDFNETLGWFFTQLNYQSSHLELLDWQFGTGFDAGETKVVNLTNSLSLEEQTWSFDYSLLTSLQGSKFMLASFSFKALNAGLQSIDFDESNSFLQDFDFVDMTTQYAGASFVINDNSSTPVPAPATLLLFVSGLALIRTKRKDS